MPGLRPGQGQGEIHLPKDMYDRLVNGPCELILALKQQGSKSQVKASRPGVSIQSGGTVEVSVESDLPALRDESIRSFVKILAKARTQGA